MNPTVMTKTLNTVTQSKLFSLQTISNIPIGLERRLTVTSKEWSPSSLPTTTARQHPFHRQYLRKQNVDTPQGLHLQDAQLPSCLDGKPTSRMWLPSRPNQPYLRDVSQLQRSDRSCPRGQVLKDKGVFLRCEGPQSSSKRQASVPVQSVPLKPPESHCPHLQSPGNNPG